MPEVFKKRSLDIPRPESLRVAILGVLLSNTPACHEEGSKNTMTLTTAGNSSHPATTSTSEKEDTSTVSTENTSPTTSSTGEGTTEKATEGAVTEGSGVDTEGHEPPEPPTVNRMPKEGEFMAIFEECYLISGTCEPVDHIITSDSLDGPWININSLDPEQCGVNPNQNAYAKNTNTWTVTKAAPLGLSMDCFETVKYGITSDPVCFIIERFE